MSVAVVAPVERGVAARVGSGIRDWVPAASVLVGCVDIVLNYDAALPKGHQTWQLNEINALIWPSPNGIGIMDQAAFDRTVSVAVEGKILQASPEGTAFRNDLAEAALEALSSDVDPNGADYEKEEVVLTEGGR